MSATVTAFADGTTQYATQLEAEGLSFTADEPSDLGGGGQGPSPSALLAAALAGCTAITLQMYGERHDWNMSGGFHVTCDYEQAKGEPLRVSRTVRVPPGLSPEQRARAAEIAERTPVTMALKQGAVITTDLTQPAPG